jgi:hypothetical protein
MLNAKKAKFAVQFYAVTGSVNPYISSFFDTHAGNKTGVCGTVEYHFIFKTLRTPYNNVFHPESKISVEKDPPSSLWLLQMAHRTRMFPNQSGHRIFFMDNFYTPHQ